MEKSAVKELINDYLEGECSGEEAGLLESWHLDYDLDSIEDLDFEDQVKDLDVVWAALQPPAPVAKGFMTWARLAALLFPGSRGI